MTQTPPSFREQRQQLRDIEDAPQVITFGCRLNTYESEVIKKISTEAGLRHTVIINTCGVTSESERQAQQTIRKLKRQNPHLQIIATGCAVQMNPQRYAEMDEVDRVIGNHEKMLPTSYAPDSSQRILVNDIMAVRETAAHLIQGYDGRVRAFIQVQNGCDHRCTFCSIPFGRGNSRSVPLGLIVEQVEKLVDKGVSEVVLTGVDVTAYGADLPGKPPFGQMIRRLLTLVPGLPRVRLSSLDPAEIDEDLWKLIETNPRLMPHYHISAQAGDDLILKRMKRRHLRADIVNFCQKVRQRRPDAVFGADLIAGFPTETETMFHHTAQLIEECQLIYLHVFPYSPRPGTPAARMPQVAPAVIKERAKLLRLKGQRHLEEYLKAQVNTTQEILVEHGNKGRTAHFAPVSILADSQVLSSTQDLIPPGTLIQAPIVGIHANTLLIHSSSSTPSRRLP